jgi:hypothetical protein
LAHLGGPAVAVSEPGTTTPNAAGRISDPLWPNGTGYRRVEGHLDTWLQLSDVVNAGNK